MNNRTLLALAAAFVFHTAGVLAAAPDAYQVTGPILELTDTKIVVQKGDERWELARTPATKITGDLKVGGKVTIQYSMSAKSIEAKPAK